eukprot:Polyplicarium_translucidae@DN873_c0_g1_i2.p1
MWNPQRTLHCPDCRLETTPAGLQTHARRVHNASTRYKTLNWCGSCCVAWTARQRHQCGPQCADFTQIILDTERKEVLSWFPAGHNELFLAKPDDLAEDSVWITVTLDNTKVAHVAPIPPEVALREGWPARNYQHHILHKHKEGGRSMRLTYCTACRQARVNMKERHVVGLAPATCTGALQIMQTYYKDGKVYPICRHERAEPA